MLSASFCIHRNPISNLNIPCLSTLCPSSLVYGPTSAHLTQLLAAILFLCAYSLISHISRIRRDRLKTWTREHIPFCLTTHGPCPPAGSTPPSPSWTLIFWFSCFWSQGPKDVGLLSVPWHITERLHMHFLEPGLLFMPTFPRRRSFLLHFLRKVLWN